LSRPSIACEYAGQNDSSLRRGIQRSNWTFQRCSPASGKRIARNGIVIFTTYPPEVTAASVYHRASNDVSKLAPLLTSDQRASHCTPTGLARNA
jgi:hypothetical protein